MSTEEQKNKVIDQENDEKAEKAGRDVNTDQAQEELEHKRQTESQQNAAVDPQNEGKGYVAPKPNIPSARNAARNHEGPIVSRSPKTDI